MGNLHLRKLIKNETIWKDKKKFKHKCVFEIHCILKVIDTSNTIKYYDVMKCKKCLSFKSISLPNNVNGVILQNITEDQKKLPMIIGYCKHNYEIGFHNLDNVSYILKK